MSFDCSSVSQLVTCDFRYELMKKLILHYRATNYMTVSVVIFFWLKKSYCLLYCTGSWCLAWSVTLYCYQLSVFIVFDSHCNTIFSEIWYLRYHPRYQDRWLSLWTMWILYEWTPAWGRHFSILSYKCLFLILLFSFWVLMSFLLCSWPYSNVRFVNTKYDRNMMESI